MVFADLITKWSNQTVIIRHFASSYDSQGNPVLSTSSDNRALVEYRTRAVTGRDGTQKVSSCQILLPSASTVTIDDSITLPDGTTPQIIAIERQPDFDGNIEYVKVFT